MPFLPFKTVDAFAVTTCNAAASQQTWPKNKTQVVSGERRGETQKFLQTFSCLLPPLCWPILVACLTFWQMFLVKTSTGCSRSLTGSGDTGAKLSVENCRRKSHLKAARKAVEKCLKIAFYYM